MMVITIDEACCKGCGICLKACPKDVFIKSKHRNNYGTAMPEAKNTEKCIACGTCEKLCPDGAINVEGESV